MQINVKGHQVEVTEALNNYAIGKFERVTRVFDQLHDVSVVLGVEKRAGRVKKLRPGLLRLSARGRNTRRTAGAWPSGKASVFGTVYRRFESYRPSQYPPGAVTPGTNLLKSMRNRRRTGTIVPGPEPVRQHPGPGGRRSPFGPGRAASETKTGGRALAR